MTQDELMSLYEQALESTSAGNSLQLSLALKTFRGPGTLQSHWNLLRQCNNRPIFNIIRSTFAKREDLTEEFLLEKLNPVRDASAAGDALQILGMRESRQARPYAVSFLDHEDPTLRYRAIIVMGWTCNPEDVEALHQTMLSDESAELRGYAATALRQVWYRFPSLQASLIEMLAEALERETNQETWGDIVLAIQTIASKRFGLKEDPDEGGTVGDRVVARDKALKWLSRRPRSS